MKLLLRTIILMLLTGIAFNLADARVDGEIIYFIGIIGGFMLYHFIFMSFMEFFGVHIERRFMTQEEFDKLRNQENDTKEKEDKDQ